MYYDAHTHYMAQTEGVTQINNVLANYTNPSFALYRSVGMHPWHLDDWHNQWHQLETAAPHPNVLAIGECGLDKVTHTPWALQTEVFTKQVLLAQSLQKPLIIHCVRAYSEVASILQKAGVHIPVVFHGFSKGMNVATPLLQKGYTLSFGAHLLHKNSNTAMVLQQTPDELFLLETDDADVPIQMIYKQAAEIRKTTEDAIILQVAKNFKKLFGVS